MPSKHGRAWQTDRVMALSWKQHALARPAKDQADFGFKRTNALQFKFTQKVVAIRDLDGVPAGTVGKIMLANGFNWKRYRILFTNGVELGDLEGSDIELLAKGDKRAKQKPVKN
jgi:hypothetical protein